MDDAAKKINRPLSPHIQIYKQSLTMAMSMFHRLTGLGLYFGALFLIWWLVALSLGGAYFGIVQDFMSSFIGRLLMFISSWGFIHHLIGGIRHFIWDLGKGFEIDQVELMAKITIILSSTITIAVWVLAYMVK